VAERDRLCPGMERDNPTTGNASGSARPRPVTLLTHDSACRCAQTLGGLHLRAADFPLPGLVAPVSVVPSAVPLPVPALGVIPDE